MAIIKNAILSPLGRLIGIAPAPQTTVLDDDSVSLVLPIVPDIARRSLGGATGGWFQGLLENVHSGADDEVSQIDPYIPGASAVAPYPGNVNADFDVWLLGVNGRRSSGSGDLTGGVVSLNPGAHLQGWGEDDVGDPVVSAPSMRLAFFDGVETQAAGIGSPPLKNPQGLLHINLNLRIPRGGTLSFHSTSAAAAEFQMFFILGLFPAALGQDVVT